VFLLEDHLGGVDGFTASSGALLTKNSYQPFGARRSGDGLSGAPTATEWLQIQSTTARGYTDHEHLDNLGIIHMNGRVYDPALGRFLSPDPMVQAPYDTQGQNRYAYVRNNPLRYTDPSGFSCVGHPAGDQFAQHCMENILTQATRLLADWQLAWFGDAALQASLNGVVSEAGSVIVPQIPDGPLENVVVTGTRPPEIPPVSIDVTNYASPSLVGELGGAVLRWRYFDEAALLLGGMLALIEPTPAGEAAIASGLIASESRALSTIRYTRPGESFVRYESNNAAFSRITATGGVRPGTYAAPLSDGLIPVTRRADFYNLPDPMILRTEIFSLRPPPNTLIIGPRPVAGGPGNEVLFPWGF
jgi:RHS repeat-associated protein